MIRFDNLRQVGLHELRHNVNLIETRSVLRTQNSLNAKDVLVVQQSLDLQFPVCSQRKHAVLECLHDFFDCYEVRLAAVLWQLRVLGGHDDAVGSLTNRIDNLVTPVDFEFGVDDHVLVHGFISVLVIRQLCYLGLLFFLAILIALHI